MSDPAEDFGDFMRDIGRVPIATQEQVDAFEARREARRTKPTIVCLCGSTRFGDAFRDAMREETLAGKIVLSVGLLGHQEGLDMDGPVKVMLDELHKRKIDLADEVLILNCGDYVGKSTASELNYARRAGKRVRFLEPHTEATS
jgi:hypothetical protein